MSRTKTMSSFQNNNRRERSNQMDYFSVRSKACGFLTSSLSKQSILTVILTISDPLLTPKPT